MLAPQKKDAAVTLGYLVNTYPRASHTFIRREIAAIEAAGMPVHRFAMRSDRAALVEAADCAEDARTEHVLEAGAAALVRAGLWAAARPGALARAFALALRMGAAGAGGGSGTGGRLRHMIYLVEAAYIARRAHLLGITHIHAHFGTNSASVALLASALGGPGYSFTAHGPEEFDAPAALSLGLKCAKARFVIAISSFGRSQLCRWAPVEAWPRIRVVHCGIDPAAFPSPTPLPQGGPHLVAIGRLAEQKGFGLLMEAMALAAPHLPGLRLTLVGDGPMRAALEVQAKRAAPGQITFVGWQDEAGVRAALAGAQALVLPSFAEGLPVVVMEAMAAGRPVIATAIAGVPELVLPGITGWLVPAGDAGAFAAAIADLAATAPEPLAAMGIAGRARVMERHDIHCEAAKLVALLRAAGA